MQLLVGVLLALPLLVITPLVAAENSASGSSATQSNTNSTTSSDDKSKETFEQEVKRLTESEDKKKSQADRLKEKIAELKIKLTTAEQTKIKLKCVVAQGNIRTLDARIDTGVVERGKAYNELLDHLDKAITKLKVSNIDTKQLEDERAVLAKKIDTFKKDLAAYKVTLADAKSIGCVADPSAFKAALETARTSRGLVAADAAAVRSYVTDTIKPTLKTIRETIEKDSPTKTDTSATPSTVAPPTKTTTGGSQ